jgi:predicted O-linked N-acetylglucosamine transferase (SPINDLY family)
MHGDLIYAMHYQPDVSADELFREHLNWAERYAAPLRIQIKPFTNDRIPDRRLRVGYISADFREHPRARFIEPLLMRHDRNQFQVLCYNDAAPPDDCTIRFSKMVDTWRETTAMSDEAVADLIRRDGIDLLVDFSGHTGSNRMLALARKPAPIQILYPGYPNTGGLKTIDYWITDAYQDPRGLTERFHTERIVRLQPFARCYTPSDNSPPVGPLPALSNGFITFGALNNAVKHNSRVLSAWSKILSALPSARILTIAEDGAQNAIAAAFAKYGIPTERLEIVPRAKRGTYLTFFSRTDILLDSFPYNGYTTTLDSLWMGVPVLTLEGDTNVSRAGMSMLSNVGLPEWIADSLNNYVERAIHFASGVPMLERLRRNLRQQMQASPLMDAAGYIRKIEAAYRAMWRTWCRSERK